VVRYQALRLQFPVRFCRFRPFRGILTGAGEFKFGLTQRDGREKYR
jgi:hypothetical protein